MSRIVLSKETSERSDKDNWVKTKLLQEGYILESIEGCNQNEQNQVTYLLERALFSNSPELLDTQTVLKSIIDLEGQESLNRKIAFCNLFNIPLSYVIYGNKPSEFVKLYSISDKIELCEEFNSYKQFSDWIKSIKRWTSTSSFKHSDDLPFFDTALRRNGTAWPTNIDCFISSADNQPQAIVEFQNASTTPLATHCNNNYFWGLTSKDDQRRWFSQEILRVQSNLPFFIITWSKIHKGFIIKQLEKVIFPNFKNFALKEKLKEFVKEKNKGINKKKIRQLYDEICKNYETEELYFENGIMKIKVNKPPLSYENKTFPMLYYTFKHRETEDNDKFIDIFKSNNL